MILLLLLLSSLCLATPALDKLKLPPGFTISLYAYPVKGARSLALGPDGIVFVGSRRDGNVYSLFPHKNGDGK